MTDNCEPSICIPRTLNNKSRHDIKDIFETIFGVSSVYRVDIITKHDIDQEHCKIFVHFNKWSQDKVINDIRERLIRGDNIKIVYDNPWFWRCSASRIPRPKVNSYSTIRNPTNIPII